MSSDEGRQRPTMSMKAAAERVGVSVDSVRRWVDEMETRGEPVAERERDEHGQPRSGAWRRPYADAVDAWRDRRRGAGGDNRDGE